MGPDPIRLWAGQKWLMELHSICRKLTRANLINFPPKTVRSAHPSDMAIRAFVIGRLKLLSIESYTWWGGAESYGSREWEGSCGKMGTDSDSDSHRDGWMDVGGPCTFPRKKKHLAFVFLVSGKDPWAHLVKSPWPPDLWVLSCDHAFFLTCPSIHCCSMPSTHWLLNTDTVLYWSWEYSFVGEIDRCIVFDITTVTVLRLWIWLLTVDEDISAYSWSHLFNFLTWS